MLQVRTRFDFGCTLIWWSFVWLLFMFRNPFFLLQTTNWLIGRAADHRIIIQLTQQHPWSFSWTAFRTNFSTWPWKSASCHWMQLVWRCSYEEVHWCCQNSGYSCLLECISSFAVSCTLVECYWIVLTKPQHQNHTVYVQVFLLVLFLLHRYQCSPADLFS